MVQDKLDFFKWYMLPAKDQKMFVHLIHRRQHSSAITMGPFQTLNYETLADVSRFPIFIDNSEMFSFFQLYFIADNEDLL